MWDKYLFATSVDHALQLLAEHGGKAQVIAGGTDLVLQAQRGQCPAEVVVDVTRIPDLDYIRQSGGYILIGAQVTHAALAASSLIREKAGVLSAACGHVGGPQTRNVGTLVGNVLNARPAADGAVALFTLDAELEVATPGGRRWEPITRIYRDIGVCSIDACFEVVTAIRFQPLTDTCGWGFQRLARRQTLTLPTLVVAAAMDVDGGLVRSVRIAMGPVARTPLRATDAETFLIGKPAHAATFAEAAELAGLEAEPRDSLIRGSGEYRKAMVPVLVRRALMQALETCKGSK